MPSFLNLLKGRKFTAVSDAAIQTSISIDTQPRLQVDAGGTLRWGPGGSTAVDTNISRSGVNTLAVSGGITLGAALPVSSGGTGGTTAPAARSALGAGPAMPLCFVIPGIVAVGTGKIRIYALVAFTIGNVRAYATTGPTGAALIFDTNLNGTTIFTTQANRPTIADGANYDATSVPDVTAVNAGDYFTVDCDQVGSTIAGSNITIQIEPA